ncbi:MAG: DNA-3-methyladenine glycosylase I [Pantoea sp.]|nr:DNA-3-methyladenine glycosylase I [Pantoea sp.]
MQRCGWVSNDPLYLTYHDSEWGIAQTQSTRLFEMLCLEGQQAGLSWITVLKKRENYRAAFYQFDPKTIAQMNESDIDRLMQDSGLIRHRAKLNAIVTNARAYLMMQENGEDFSRFIWAFVGHQPQINHFTEGAVVPAQTPASLALSKALKKRGFKFVGATICYAFMQACGLVNDHLTGCFRHPDNQLR